MKSVIKTAIFFFCLFLTAACSPSDRSEIQVESSDSLDLMKRTEMAQEENAAAIEPLERPEKKSQSHMRAFDERKVMYTAHVEIIVAQFAEAEEKIAELVRNENGYIVHSNVHRKDKKNIRGQMTIKIPQKKFETFLAQIGDLSVEVVNQSIQGEDATEEYVDLEARLKAKYDVKKKLESFLKEADETKDLLEISKEIGSVQEEIEQLEGRLNYLKNATDFSTVTILITERKQELGELGLQDSNTWVRAKQLFVSTIDAMFAFASGAMVIAVGLSPLVLPVILIAAALWLYWKRKKKKEVSRE